MLTERHRGFTLIELLVTLVLLGLVAGLATPALDSWLTARQLAAQRNAVISELAALPLQARVLGESFLIALPEQLENDKVDISIIKPIHVLANGFCMGGELQIRQGARIQKLVVKQPFCDIDLAP